MDNDNACIHYFYSVLEGWTTWTKGELRQYWCARYLSKSPASGNEDVQCRYKSEGVQRFLRKHTLEVSKAFTEPATIRSLSIVCSDMGIVFGEDSGGSLVKARSKLLVREFAAFGRPPELVRFPMLLRFLSPSLSNPSTTAQTTFCFTCEKLTLLEFELFRTLSFRTFTIIGLLTCRRREGRIVGQAGKSLDNRLPALQCMSLRLHYFASK